MGKKEFTIEELMAAGFSVDEIKDLVGQASQPSSEQKQQPKKEEFSLDPLKAAAAGAAQGFSYGFADDLLGEDYKKEVERLEKEHPLAFETGDIAGSFLSPDPVGTKARLLTKVPKLGKVLKSVPGIEKMFSGAATGAVAGGLEALGQADDKSADVAAEGAQSGALMGAGVAGVLDAVAKAVPSGFKGAAKILIPSASKREQLSDTFKKTQEKLKEGVDFTSKEYAESMSKGLKDETVSFVEKLLSDINAKKSSLYQDVAKIAEESKTKIDANEVRRLLSAVDEMANPNLRKSIEKAIEGKNDLSYSEVRNLEQKLEKIIDSSSQDFVTRDAALELKKTLKSKIEEALPEKGKQALAKADEFYRRTLGIDPNTGKVIGDFFEVAGKNIADLPKYDKAALGDETVRIADRIITRGTGFKYDPTDVYSSGVKSFDEFVKLADNPNDPKLLEKWNVIKDKLNEQSLLENLFGESFREATPRLSKVDPVGYLTRVGFNTTAMAAKGLERLSPISQPIFNLLKSMDPEQVRRQIEEYESKGHKGIAEYLRRQYQLALAETPKASKVAAQQLVESQNPGLKEIKKRMVGEEEDKD